jgi:hypothetical protein
MKVETWKHLLPIMKYLFLRNSYVCPKWILIFDTDQAQSISGNVRPVILVHEMPIFKEGS